MEPRFIKSSFCGHPGCVEAAAVPAAFATSSYSDADCVSAAAIDAIVYVRDSKNPGELTLSFPATAWDGFIELVIAGCYDLDSLCAPVSGPVSGKHGVVMDRPAPDIVRLYCCGEPEHRLVYTDDELVAFVLGAKAGEFHSSRLLLVGAT